MLRKMTMAVLATAGLFALGVATSAESGGTCAAQCDADPNTAAYCQEVCAGAKPAEERDAIDWRCVSGCRKRGGKLQDCVRHCPAPTVR